MERKPMSDNDLLRNVHGIVNSHLIRLTGGQLKQRSTFSR